MQYSVCRSILSTAIVISCQHCLFHCHIKLKSESKHSVLTIWELVNLPRSGVPKSPFQPHSNVITLSTAPYLQVTHLTPLYPFLSLARLLQLVRLSHSRLVWYSNCNNKLEDPGCSELKWRCSTRRFRRRVKKACRGDRRKRSAL